MHLGNSITINYILDLVALFVFLTAEIHSLHKDVSMCHVYAYKVSCHCDLFPQIVNHISLSLILHPLHFPISKF